MGCPDFMEKDVTMTVDRGTLERSSNGKLSRKEFLGAGIALSAFLILYYISGFFIGQLYMGCYDVDESWFCQAVLDDPIVDHLLFYLIEPLVLGGVSVFFARIGVKTADQRLVFAVFTAGLALFLLGERGFYYFFESYWIVGFQDIVLSVIYFLMVATGAFLAHRAGGEWYASTGGDAHVTGGQQRLAVGYIVCGLLVLHVFFYFCTAWLFDGGGGGFAVTVGLWLLVAVAGVVLLHRAPRQGERSERLRISALVIAYVLLTVLVVIAGFLVLLAATFHL